MPKSRKRPQEHTHANRAGGNPAKQFGRAPATLGDLPRLSHAVATDGNEAAPVGPGDFSFSRGLTAGQATDNDWATLHREFLAEHPRCPDCDAAWDLTLAAEEEGHGPDGYVEISLSVSCPAYDASLDAGREPSRHPRMGGFLHHALALG